MEHLKVYMETALRYIRYEQAAVKAQEAYYLAIKLEDPKEIN
jgi:hypothetical protein